VTDVPRGSASERAYLEIEERYRQLAELSSDAVLISQGGRIVYANPASAALLRIGSPSDILGRRVYEFVHPDFIDVARQRAQRVVSGRSLAETIETRWVRLDGQVVDVQVTAMPVTFDGQPAAQIVIRDITDRKQAEAQLRASERRYRTIFEAAGVAIWEVDFSEVKSALTKLPWTEIVELRTYLDAHPDVVASLLACVRVIAVNPAGLALVDAHDLRELVSALDTIFAPETTPSFIEDLVALIEGRTELTAETMIRSVHGDPIDVLFTVRFPSAEDSGDAVLVSLVDITHRKGAELAVTQALATAEDALRVREEFLSVATHELRTPLTSLRMAAQYVRRRFEREPDGLPDWCFSLANMMDEQSRKLARMVDQLLDLSRLEGGRLVPERQQVDLMPIVREVAEIGRTFSKSHAVVVLGPDELYLDVDPLRIEQVLVNLVTNAVKFSPSGGDVTIDVDSLADSIQIRVTDQGIGIPDEYREHIFERYFQVERSERGTGLGLGLFVSQQIVELHGGRIWIETPPFGGTQVIVSLPIDPVNTHT
jgi:PAS domain S-box-containing protein